MPIGKIDLERLKTWRLLQFLNVVKVYPVRPTLNVEKNTKILVLVNWVMALSDYQKNSISRDVVSQADMRNLCFLL